VRPTSSTVSTVSTVAGSAQVMGIDAEGMGTVLSILSNMYSDPGLAVVREYASNAYDAHVEAGNPDPILVTSPSLINPIFTVQDFGVGLSRDEMLNVYAQYGASTKRGTNDQIGAFGIGAKSAFTAGTQFVVTAVKNGETTVALFALNDDGAPTVNIVSHTYATDEPNGVKVEIGVNDVHGVKMAIEKLFPTWKPGTVLVDGVEPVSVWTDLDALTDNVHFGWRENHYETRSEAWIIVMGGIPYKLPDAVVYTLESRQNTMVRTVQQSQARVYLTVPIGSVDITPSREELRVTDRTTATINALVEEFSENIGAWISIQIEESTSVIDALMRYRKLRDRLGSIDRQTLRDVTWRGAALPQNTIDFPDLAWFELHAKRGHYGEQVARRQKRVQLHPAEYFEKYLFVTDVPDRRVRSVQLAAKPYLKAQDSGITRVVALTGESVNYVTEWFDPSDPALNVTDFETFVTEWKPAPTPGQRNEVRYFLHGESDTVTATELNQETDVFYLTSAEEKRITRRSNALFLKVVGTATVVLLTHQQKAEALVRRVPHAKPLHPAMTEAARKLVRNLSQADKDLIFASKFIRVASSTVIRWLIEHKAEITNEVALKVVAQYEAAVALQDSNLTRMGLLRTASEFLGGGLVADPDGDRFENLNKIMNRLPLLENYLVRSYGSRTQLGNEHAVMYVNAVKL
jgi:hypothetical protein